MSILAFHFTFLDQNRLKMRFSNLNALRKGLLMQDLIFRIEAKSIFMSLSFKSTKKNTFLQARSKKACNFLWAKSNLCNLEISCLCTRTTDAQWSLFSPKFQTFGLGQTIWADKFWDICHLGLFSADLLALILVLWVPCPCFPLINHYFYKK